MLNLSRSVIALLFVLVLAGCAYNLESEAEPERTTMEKWAGVSKEEFVDKDTHMKGFYEKKIKAQEKEIAEKTKELDEMSQSKPTKWEDVLHDEMKKDRLEREISEAKKSKRNWEKLLNEHVKEREGGGDGDGGGGGSSGGC
jgi:cytochrome c556